MKKIFGMTVLLFILYFLYQLVFIYFQGGHNINYALVDGDTNIEINEILNSSNKKDKDNYSLTLTVNDRKFSIQTFHNFHRSSYIVKQVNFFEDNNYACVFVKYRQDNILNDVICTNNNVMYNYHDIKEPSQELNDFVNSLEQYGYNSNNWKDDLDVTTTEQNFILYDNNLIENNYVGINSSTGLYRINTVDKINYVQIYSSKVNDSAIKINGFIEDRYILAYYDEGNIVRYYVNNITNNGSRSFINGELSTNSYVLGVYDKSLYVYDPDTRKEYEIDYESERVLEVGNPDTGYLYFDAGILKRTSNISNAIFGSDYENDYVNDKYAKIIKVGHDYGYYYLFERSGGSYKVYRCNINDKENILYLFETTNIDNFVFSDDYIYYVENDCLKYYSDATGNRTLLKNDEIFNNHTTKIGIYISDNKS